MGSKHGITLLLGLCLAVTACGDSSTPPPSTTAPPSDTDSVATTGTEPGGGDPGGEPDPGKPPGVPGGPIDYNNTLFSGLTPAEAKAAMEAQIKAKCGDGMCGVTVRTSGPGNCVDRVGPRPVYPGGVITVHAKKCDTGGTTTAEQRTTTTTSRKPAATTG